jgi:phosphoglycerate dehydrogenase-like enzyme
VTPPADGRYSDLDLEEMAGASVLVVGLDQLPSEVLERSTSLRLVQRLGVGYCNIDLDAARRRGIPVCNLPDFNAGAVAEHTIMMILALQRRLFDSTLWMKAGRWPTHEIVSAGIFELSGKTIGLVGFGAIGQAVARRAQGFEISMSYYDRSTASAAKALHLNAAPLPLPELLSLSDIVSIHLPLTPETRHLIRASELALMKPTALVINTARAAIIDEIALADALRAQRLGGAGLDVFEDEPLPARHPLRSCPNVLLTPHLAGQTREAMERMATAMVANLLRVERNEDPLYRVN